jgi:pimeloyl-ACP methyl ester carboxylesterase
MLETEWRKFFVLNSLFSSFGFVSDFEIRISNFWSSPRIAGLGIAGLIVCVALTGSPALADGLQPAFTEAGQHGVVFAINGAGNLHATSTALENAVADAGLPLAVVEVEWSHGRGRFVADQTDWRHAQDQGRRLASQIASYRQANPGRAVYLVAHSAGSGVALSAAAAVPPGSLNRVILLAPSVSSDYDLRPALRGTRDGMDVFYSRRDVFSLGLGVALAGSCDGWRRCQAAGRVGFRAEAETPEDAGLYAKLKQYPWQRCQARFGNRGLHSGGHRPRFLHTFVLPLLNPTQLAAN